MRVDQHFLFLGVTLAALAPVITAGCSKQADDLATPSATTSAGNEIDDTVITTRVKSALLGDPDIKSFDLKVETRKGTVLLSGFVDSKDQVDRAIKVTREVEGVKSVENSISLKDGHATVGNVVDDGVITTTVKSSLLGDPNIKSFDIAVVTRKGDVQLSGFVDSQAQMDQAIAIASKVEGVTHVRNEMSIKK